MDEEIYCFSDLKYKFDGPKNTNVLSKKQISYAEKRGVILEPYLGKKEGRKNFYKIVKILYNVDKKEYGKTFKKNPHFEVCKEGQVRRSDTKAFVGHTNKFGYIIVSDDNYPEGALRDYRVNRLVMETGNPIENPENYVVDHINRDKNG